MSDAQVRNLRSVSADGRPYQPHQPEPQRMLIIGYNTVEEFIAKGMIVRGNTLSAELQFNLGRPFAKVAYIVPFGRKNSSEKLSETVEYRELAFARHPNKVLSGLLHLRQALRFLSAAVRDFHPDVVMLYGPNIPAVLARLSRPVRALPVVCLVDAFWEQILQQQEYIPSWARRLLPLWYRYVYRCFDSYSGAPSLNCEFYISRGMRSEKIAKWMNPLDVRMIDRAEELDIPPEVRDRCKPWIVTVGRLHPEKLPLDALQIFAEAVRRGGRGTLIFVGDGALRSAIDSSAAELGIADRIIVTGFLPQRSVFAILKAAELSIAPMQGMALLETLAAGTATVAYDHETHRALVRHDETGILVPHLDVGSAAAALANLLSDQATARRIASCARAWVEENYSVAQMKDIFRDGPVLAWRRRQGH